MKDSVFSNCKFKTQLFIVLNAFVLSWISVHNTFLKLIFLEDPYCFNWCFFLQRNT